MTLFSLKTNMARYKKVALLPFIQAGVSIGTTQSNIIITIRFLAYLNQWQIYSQVIREKLGEKQFSDYTRRFAYGNQDVSGDKGMNNGLTHCWLSSSLTISPKEHIHFLNK